MKYRKKSLEHQKLLRIALINRQLKCLQRLALEDKFKINLMWEYL